MIFQKLSWRAGRDSNPDPRLEVWCSIQLSYRRLLMGHDLIRAHRRDGAPQGQLSHRDPFNGKCRNLQSGPISRPGRHFPDARQIREPGSSIRARQSEHMLGQKAQNEIGRDRRDLIQPGLPELPFDVEFLGEAETAMSLNAAFRRGPGRSAASIFAMFASAPQG